MKIAFKNGAAYEAQSLLEQKVFNSNASGWVVGFSFSGNLNSQSLDELLTAENISQLTVTDADGAATTVLAGYEKVTSAVIRHTAPSSAIAEVQFSKGL